MQETVSSLVDSHVVGGDKAARADLVLVQLQVHAHRAGRDVVHAGVRAVGYLHRVRAEVLVVVAVELESRIILHVIRVSVHPHVRLDGLLVQCVSVELEVLQNVEVVVEVHAQVLGVDTILRVGTCQSHVVVIIRSAVCRVVHLPLINSYLIMGAIVVVEMRNVHFCPPERSYNHRS